MKTAFLVWHKRGRPQEGPFHFEPYLYGPCAFDLYNSLDNLIREGLAVQVPHAHRWASYYLTEAGKQAAMAARARLGGELSAMIEETARWAADQSFRRLLNEVYRLAPEFAVNSVMRESSN